MLGRISRFCTFIGNELVIITCPGAVLPAFIIEFTVDSRFFRNKPRCGINRLLYWLVASAELYPAGVRLTANIFDEKTAKTKNKVKKTMMSFRVV